MPLTFCVSEEEAKTKWCPMVRAGDINLGGTENRPDGSFNCIGSGCMAWRYVLTNINDGKGGPMEPSGDTHGVCGLAGGPARP